MKPISQKEFHSSIILVLSSTFFLSLAAAFWKEFLTETSLPFVIFLRFFSPCLLFGIWILIRKIKVRISHLKSHIYRALSVTSGQVLFLYVLSKTNLLLATLLYSTSGLFAPLLMLIFLKVRASSRAVISIIVSFAGVVISLGSWDHIWAPISLLGLLSGLLTATGQLIQHQTAKSEDIVVMSFILFGLSTLFSLPLFFITPLVPPPIDLSTLAIILTFGLLTIGNQIFKTMAYKKVNKASTLSPYLYGAIIFSGIIDWVWRGIIPSFHTNLGILIILFGSALMLLRKNPQR
jgi:drug/metabolite transporter (DMT)-like permease